MQEKDYHNTFTYTLSSYLDEPEPIKLDSKTMSRYRRYMKFIVSKKTCSLKPRQFGGFNFEYDLTNPKDKRVVLLALKINNYACDLVIPKGYVRGIYIERLKKWEVIGNLKKGDRFQVDESLYRLFPSLFKANKMYTLSDDIQIIYYSFSDKQDLLRLTKHILFQQIKMIYRYQKNVSKKYKNN